MNAGKKIDRKTYDTQHFNANFPFLLKKMNTQPKWKA